MAKLQEAFGDVEDVRNQIQQAHGNPPNLGTSLLSLYDATYDSPFTYVYKLKQAFENDPALNQSRSPNPNQNPSG